MVEEFREEEVGLYRCRVDFRTAQTRNTFINVSLIGEIVKILIPIPVVCLGSNNNAFNN